MRTVLELANGNRWDALDTDEDGDVAMRGTATAIGMFFKSELHYRSDDQAYVPSEFYVLVAADGSMPACGAIIAESSTNGSFCTQFVGYRNYDPFLDHAEDIRALGEHLGVDLGPEVYPYKNMVGKRYEERPVDSDEETSAPRP